MRPTVVGLIIIICVVSFTSCIISILTYNQLSAVQSNNSAVEEELQNLRSRIISVDKKLDYILPRIIAEGGFYYPNPSSSSPPPTQPQQEKMEELKVDDEAPNFYLREIREDKYIELKKFKDKKNVILLAWDVGCPHCIKLIPQVKEFYKYLMNKFEDVEFFSVTKAANSQEEQLIFKIIKDKGVNYPVLVAYDPQFGKDYKIRRIPVMFVINKKLKIAAIYHGKELHSKELTKLIDTRDFKIKQKKKK